MTQHSLSKSAMQYIPIDPIRFGYSALIALALARVRDEFSEYSSGGSEQAPVRRDLSGYGFGDGLCLMTQCENPSVNSVGEQPNPKVLPVNSAPGKPSHRILVVEDEPLLRKLNREALVRSGFHVDDAEDGEVAWDALQATRYDLVVTDHKMPKMTGIELLHKLHSSGMALPVIMASGTLSHAELGNYPGLKPAAVLSKPYTLDELVLVVRAVLDGRDVTGRMA